MGHEATDVDAFYKVKWLLFGFWKRVTFLWGYFCLAELLFVGVIVGLCAYAGISWPDEESTGIVASLGMGAALALTPRRGILHYLFDFGFDRTIAWHIFFAYTALGLGLFHGIACMFEEGNWNPFQDDEFTTGSLSVIAMLVLTLTSLPIIRRRLFEVFMKFHWIAFPAAVILAIIHVGGEAFAIYGGGALFAIDLILRFVFVMVNSPNAKVNLKALPSGVAMVEFERKFVFEAGQYAFLFIPAVAWTELHPFSITSGNMDQTVRFYIKNEGNWTEKLINMAKDGASVTVFADPAIGKIGLDWKGSRYHSFVFFAGGIGVTPMLSIARDLAEDKRNGRDIEIFFHWAVRDIQLFYDILSHEKEFAAQVQAGLINFTLHFTAKGESTSKPKDWAYDYTVERTRANVGDILSSFKQREGHVAALACGPPKLRTSVMAESSKRGYVDFHVETFLF
eukprot:m.220570 g.220570  ORF g.220570 m.220570 type:complete len:452 (+) comp15117_c0_seq1:506-1861(+)